MDPRYKDFGGVEFSALHPTIQKRCEIRVDPRSIQAGQHSKALAVTWLVGGGGGGGGGGGSNLAAYW